MKLEIARALFLVAGLAVTTVAVAAWEEPRPTVFSKAEMAAQCALPRDVKPQQKARVEPDQDLLLLLFGLRQGLRPFG
ncbi:MULTISPECIES: hypothetical protein [Gammaproteobacteria]|jgi:hypothetical protein|uniref:Uncharacterized protein n=1 Tax=Pseudomonas juntendi TaxID=2666183 RepID=A0A7W2QUD2_9PSED|nr:MULTISPECIES: hypothetical protein [Pseudomonas]NOY04456.1 hypothetical protein [Gammaproteobacteria bacterium]PPB13467.1 hypothetical protein HV87_01455 [Pseudomonas aeruginosa]EGB97729.2 hypothetical protein G1E_16938 [Pseudomonas sp. TJI-51]MBA6059220.1 hypothetical protein [Pseudomonas juntendi]MBA6097678.1 hypothetical protein [Pseudomonas juntendi]